VLEEYAYFKLTSYALACAHFPFLLFLFRVHNLNVGAKQPMIKNRHLDIIVHSGCFAPTEPNHHLPIVLIVGQVIVLEEYVHFKLTSYALACAHFPFLLFLFRVHNLNVGAKHLK